MAGASGDPAQLDAIVERSCAPESLYWSFRADEADRSAIHNVEIRINLDAADAAAFYTPVGWVLARRESDAVFLRRRQSLSDQDVKILIGDALRIAWDRNGQFQSWLHAPDLD